MQMLDDRFSKLSDRLLNKFKTMLQETEDRILKELDRKLRDIRTDFNELNERVSRLEKGSEEMAQMKSEIDDLRMQLLRQENSHVASEIRVNGIPYQHDENLLEVFTNICDSMNLSKPRVKSIHRLQNRNNTKKQNSPDGVILVVTFCAEFALIPLPDHSSSSLQVELDDLERRWRQLVAVYENEMTSTDINLTKEARGEIHGKFTECCRSYKECKSSILDLIHIEQQKLLSSEPKSKEEKVSNSGSGFSLKLPPCDTELFSGGYYKWPSFRDMFTAIYIKHEQLSPAQKLFHLRAKTRGEANQIVKRFPLTDSNFDLAWEALRQRFENKRILINHQLRKIFEIDHVSSEKEKSLRNLQYTINNCLSVLRTYNISVISWDPILVYWVSSKLPDDTLTAWESSLSNNKEMPSWDQLDEFITKRLNMIESVSDIRKQNSHSSNSQKVASYNTSASTEGFQKTCKACKQNHPLRNCSKFRSWPLSDKKKFVFDHKVCENCLSYGHIAKKCKSEHRCQTCRQSHHTLLHPEECNNNMQVSATAGPRPNQRWQTSKPTSASYHVETYYDEQPTTSAAAYSQISNTQSNFSQSGERTVLPTALIDIEHQGFLFTIRAFIDQGSQESFISSRIINRFDIPTKKAFTLISGLGGTVLENSFKSCQITLKSRQSDFKLTTTAIVVSSLNQLMPSSPASINDFTNIQQLQLADPNFFKPAPIDMLIGSDVLPRIIKTGLQKDVSGNLLAQSTEFGWIISGKPSSNSVVSFSSWTTTIDPLNDELKKFWELESIPNEKSLSTSDIWCEEFYMNTVTRRSDGKYVVRLPFKQNLPSDKCLGSSRPAAMGQFLRMEKTLERNPELSTEYNKVLAEYITLGHMKLTTNSEIVHNSQFLSYYLPHHAVVKPERTSTKVRVVFNASKRTASGLSLNDILYTGPTLQNELMNVVLRIFFKYVFNGDIQKMYRQIFINEKDQQFQRILFRSSPLEKVEDYCLETVTFGVNCAPYLAIRTLLQLSNDGKDSHPTASQILKSQIYVDDILSGAHSLTEAKSYLHEVIDLLNSAGFPLTKITSNHPQILLNLPPEDLLNEDLLRIEEVSETKTLGIQWNAISDHFFYKVTHFDLPTVSVTKRKVLSIVAKLFDPAGWNSAMAQFFRNEARLIRTPKFKEEYDEVLNEYITLGHMTKVTNDSNSVPCYYLPHHAVVRPESTTTKVRVVFNASSASSNDPKIGNSPMSIVNRWQRLKVIHQQFCQRWKDEYLKELHKRHKWQHPVENLKEGMMVVIKEDNIPPNSWRLGRITKAFPGRDNLIRIVEIKTERGTVTRPVTKLVVIPLEDTAAQMRNE
ncbi:uncharacterized protein [Musca autumnalis]|uniref:uncharacterized protein n=1 Tax=Musca autumnalis TaxID=221902 RepID=UPI003CEA473C